MSRTYGTATFGSFSPTVEGATNPGTDTTYTESQGNYVSRDGFVNLSFRISFAFLTGGGDPATGTFVVVFPETPLPKYTVPTCSYSFTTTDNLGLGNTERLEGLVQNFNSKTVLTLRRIEMTGVGTNPISSAIITSGTITGSITYPTTSV